MKAKGEGLNTKLRQMRRGIMGAWVEEGDREGTLARREGEGVLKLKLQRQLTRMCWCWRERQAGRAKSGRNALLEHSGSGTGLR